MILRHERTNLHITTEGVYRSHFDRCNVYKVLTNISNAVKSYIHSRTELIQGLSNLPIVYNCTAIALQYTDINLICQITQYSAAD